MSSPDFAAAQQRILARRAARSQALLAQQRSAIPSTASTPPTALLAVPAPLRAVFLSTLATLQQPFGTHPSFRVGQVDAELLDSELLGLLRGQITEGLKLLAPHAGDDWGTEIAALLRAGLWKLGFWDTGASYGARLQGLKYVDGEGNEPSRLQKGVYGGVSVLGRYVWDKWEDWLLEKEGGYDATPAVRRASRLTKWVSSTHEVAAFAGFLVFLYNGRYRTLLDRVLKLRLVPASAQTAREVSFEYLNRQLVWHAFTEFLLFILPLVGIARWRRWLGRAWRKIKSTVTRRRTTDDDEIPAQGELAFLPERTCAICYQDLNPTAGASESDILAASAGGGGVVGSAQTDITNPYEAVPCGDVYCFSCLARRIEAEDGEGWPCLRCGEMVTECRPWSGDVIEEDEGPHTEPSQGNRTARKSVVFVDDAGDADDQDGEKYFEEDPVERVLTPVEPMPLEDEDEEEHQATWIGYEDQDHEHDADGASYASESEVEEEDDGY